MTIMSIESFDLADVEIEMSDFYENVSQDHLNDARAKYATAIQLFLQPIRVDERTSEGINIIQNQLLTIISLLDDALVLVPDLLDAKFVREEVWHRILTGPSERDIYRDFYLQSKAWIKKKGCVKKRDGNQCVNCKTDKTLEVHHKTYENKGKEPLSDLITLCRTCHAKQHEKSI